MDSMNGEPCAGYVHNGVKPTHIPFSPTNANGLLQAVSGNGFDFAGSLQLGRANDSFPLGQLLEPALEPAPPALPPVPHKMAPVSQQSGANAGKMSDAGSAPPANHLNGFSELCGIISNLVEERTADYMGSPPGVGGEMFPEEDLIDDEPEPADVDGTVYCNPGSIGHPDVCSRKCLYFASGDCSNGENCRFCHMAHPKRPPRLDRMNRELLRNMTFEERAVIVLPIIKQKVQALCLSLGPVVALESCIYKEFPSFNNSGCLEAKGQVSQQLQLKLPKLKMLRNALKWHNARFLTMLLRDASASPEMKATLEPLAEQMRLY